MQLSYAHQYEQLWHHHWWWQSRKQFLLGKLRQLHQGHRLKQILDIGCGNGLFFDELEQFGQVRGIESDPRLVSEDGGSRRGRIVVRSFDATYRPVEGGRFDLVLMLDVLEHIEDDATAARHVRKILAPEGIFLVTVPALMALWSQHDVANGHFRRYTKKRLRTVLIEAGFEIESLHYFFGWTIAPMLLRRVLAPAKDGSAGYQVHVPARPVNALLYALSRLEQTLGGSWMPSGSSLVAIARARASLPLLRESAVSPLACRSTAQVP